MQIVKIMKFVWLLTFMLKCFSIKHLWKTYLCMHFEVIRTSSERLSHDYCQEYKSWNISWNPFAWWRLVLPSKNLNLEKCKTSTWPYIEDLSKDTWEHPTLRWSCTKVYIRMMKYMTMRTKLQNGSPLQLKDNILSSISSH